MSVDWRGTNADRIRHRIDDLEPLLAFDASDVWRLKDTDLDAQSDGHALLLRLVDIGAVRVVGKEFDGGKERNKYRWNADARAALQEYRGQAARLDCGCRAHIGDGRDAPAGHLRCKHCGAVHSKAHVREVMS
jgi:hypothetical protein